MCPTAFPAHRCPLPSVLPPRQGPQLTELFPAYIFHLTSVACPHTPPSVKARHSILGSPDGPQCHSVHLDVIGRQALNFDAAHIGRPSKRRPILVTGQRGSPKLNLQVSSWNDPSSGGARVSSSAWRLLTPAPDALALAIAACRLVTATANGLHTTAWLASVIRFGPDRLLLLLAVSDIHRMLLLGLGLGLDQPLRAGRPRRGGLLAIISHDMPALVAIAWVVLLLLLPLIRVPRERGTPSHAPQQTP